MLLFGVIILLLIHCYQCLEKPNFIFILTDDQDLLLDGLIPLVHTKKLIANEGVIFDNAYVSSPICCPSRSTILTGKYAHNTGVINNSLSGNCSSSQWQVNHEPYTIASILKENLYKTFYAGKYLNEYGSNKSGGTKHIPKGYDWWIGLKGNSKYYNYSLSINGTEHFFSNTYLTDHMKDYAMQFLNQKYVEVEPFFMMLATPASHAPFTPATRHEKRFPNVKAVRNPPFNFSTTDKHWLIQMDPKYLPENVTILDNIQKGRLQTLLAVDEMVETLVQKLKSLNLLNKTYIIFTSDNGFHIGQFTQPWDKRQPYQSDINVPFFISGPNVRKKIISHFPITTIDIAPTILDLANIKISETMDGLSFKNQILVSAPETAVISRNILIEYWGEGSKETVDKRCSLQNSNDFSECSLENWCKCQDSKNNSYSCVLHITNHMKYKYCEFVDDKNFIEAYDLLRDPYELKNEVNEMNQIVIEYYKYTVHKLKLCQGQNECNI